MRFVHPPCLSAQVPLTRSRTPDAAAPAATWQSDYLQFVDIAAPELGGRHVSHHLRGAHAILFVADLTNFASLRAIDEWRARLAVESPTQPPPALFLFLNKKDALRNGAAPAPAPGSANTNRGTSSTSSSASSSPTVGVSAPSALPTVPLAPVLGGSSMSAISDASAARESRYIAAARARQASLSGSASRLPPRAPTPTSMPVIYDSFTSARPDSAAAAAALLAQSAPLSADDSVQPEPMFVSAGRLLGGARATLTGERLSISGQHNSTLSAAAILGELLELGECDLVSLDAPTPPSSLHASNSGFGGESGPPHFGASLALKTQVIDQFCAAAGVLYWAMTSCKSGRSVHDALDTIVSLMLQSRHGVPPAPPALEPQPLVQPPTGGATRIAALPDALDDGTAPHHVYSMCAVDDSGGGSWSKGAQSPHTAACLELIAAFRARMLERLGAASASTSAASILHSETAALLRHACARLARMAVSLSGGDDCEARANAWLAEFEAQSQMWLHRLPA